MLNFKNYQKEYGDRLKKNFAELLWLYNELYSNDLDAFERLCVLMQEGYENRKESLKELDRQREKDINWYKSNQLLGMMMYTNAFAGGLKGTLEKLDYVVDAGCNYLHFMPLLESPKGRSDGGYAVADFRKVQPSLGTMEDLEALTDACHNRGISCCLDFVMNHTSEDHAWAKAARAGDAEARKKYFFYEDRSIPDEYEKTVPQVFPTTAPGNFTWLEDAKQYVMTSFYPYQWDLNYGNPDVFNEMVANLLFLVNRGIDVIRLDAVPYIWKELGTDCRNLPQVHTLVRMMRIICEAVCPGVLLLGEVVMEPAKVVPYFGSVEKPECHMLYNVTTMATTWHTVATRDVRLLRRQLDIVNALPKEYVFLNYLRCHDDIGWGLDYPWLRNFGMEEVPHKKYLNDYLTGKWPGSNARGELYNDDPTLGDARLCGTTASLCGVEAALQEGDAEKLNRSIRCDLMLHAYMLLQSGIPVIYSGDEIGQLNDHGYHQDEEKAADSRYLHRGDFEWEKAELRNTEGSFQNRIFADLKNLEDIRKKYQVFASDANVSTVDTWNDQMLGIRRENGKEEILGFFNFGDQSCKVHWNTDGYQILTSKEAIQQYGEGIVLKGCGYVWLYRS